MGEGIGYGTRCLLAIYLGFELPMNICCGDYTEQPNLVLLNVEYVIHEKDMNMQSRHFEQGAEVPTARISTTMSRPKVKLDDTQAWEN